MIIGCVILLSRYGAMAQLKTDITEQFFRMPNRKSLTTSSKRKFKPKEKTGVQMQ